MKNSRKFPDMGLKCSQVNNLFLLHVGKCNNGGAKRTIKTSPITKSKIALFFAEYISTIDLNIGYSGVG